MANELKDTIKDCIHNIDVLRRFIRPEEAVEYFGLDLEDVLEVALAAGAKYQFPRITLIHVERMVYWVIIAKQGKIPPELEFSGTGFSNLLSFASVIQFDDYFYDYTPEERNWFRLKFLKWYDKTLCENGMEYKLVCKRENDDLARGEQFNIIGNIEDLSYKLDPFRIVAYWEPLR